MVNNKREPVITVKNLTKEFVIPHKQHNSLKSLFVNLGRKGKADKRKVLSDIDFTINKGDFFGIVGRNGSGKSTLLKLLAGVYTPTKGEISVSGSLIPFIELGVGFNPDLTGRENVFLNGALLGFTHKQMEAMYKDIVDFAELHDFMDQKLKNYSSGMQVRLAFSIAIRARSDILLLDEVLAVGDAAFQQKCTDYFYELKKKGVTVCLVSHNPAALRKFCNKALLLEKGKIVKVSNITDVLDIYEKDIADQKDKKIAQQNIVASQKITNINPDYKLEKVSIIQNGTSKKKIIAEQKYQLKIDLNIKQEVQKANVGINILTQGGLLLFAANTDQLNGPTKLKQGKVSIIFEIENIFANGEYSVNIAMVNMCKKGDSLLLKEQNAYRFVVHDSKGHWNSLINPKTKVRII